jgi:hypothetical protein
MPFADVATRIAPSQHSAIAKWTAAVASFGRQRLQGRKPAASAAAQVAWKATFSRSAGRETQLGRQYTPVVRTE